uniref:Putative ovule protein n=1 Tax=Solanum chacoense TaxID=4108 RepID=A0A0V0GW39_SOLCH
MSFMFLIPIPRSPVIFCFLITGFSVKTSKVLFQKVQGTHKGVYNSKNVSRHRLKHTFNHNHSTTISKNLTLPTIQSFNNFATISSK